MLGLKVFERPLKLNLHRVGSSSQETRLPMTSVEIAEGLGLTMGGAVPKDPNQTKTIWQYYQCVKPQHVVGFSASTFVCSKTRVPFFEMGNHRFNTRAPALLSDTLQRHWIWWSHPDVTFWPPSTV